MANNKIKLQGAHNISKTLSPDIDTEQLLSKALKFIPTPNPVTDRESLNDLLKFKHTIICRISSSKYDEQQNHC